MKLSATQAEVVELMRNGWELVEQTLFSRRCWLQYSGCDDGLDTKNVSRSTLHSLLRKGTIIGASRKFPIVTYKLTDG